LLLLTTGDIDGKSAEYDERVLIHPAQIGCTLSSLIEKLEIGQPVWIDDGKLGAIVEAVTEQGALLRVTEAKASGVRIQSDKGINFPEADFNLPPLTPKDLTDLDFVCEHADLVGFSFVETLAEMEQLMSELAKRNASELPIIAKKGTRSRPEFTDAARAECVMLNKGPYILDAIEALVNVMIRMHEHQRKKFSRLRALHW
jgi:pyruvate kinase